MEILTAVQYRTFFEYIETHCDARPVPPPAALLAGERACDRSRLVLASRDLRRVWPPRLAPRRRRRLQRVCGALRGRLTGGTSYRKRQGKKKTFPQGGEITCDFPTGRGHRSGGGGERHSAKRLESNGASPPSAAAAYAPQNVRPSVPSALDAAASFLPANSRSLAKPGDGKEAPEEKLPAPPGDPETKKETAIKLRLRLRARASAARERKAT
ncbi:MAG: hypothetical protein BJ554DRAFT_3061, partial [Olpidium bornovanus]